MYKRKATQAAMSSAERERAMLDGLRSRLRSLDLRIARMRELHTGSPDPLAERLIKHSLVERAELASKLN